MAASRHSYVQTSKPILKAFLEGHGVPESHGYDHALQVLSYCDEALGIADPAGWNDFHLAVGLAALFHEVDDRKYFPWDEEVGEDLPNARALLRETFKASQIDWTKVIEMTLCAIRLVSAHANGNNIPPIGAPYFHPLLLTPRYADRLAASGVEGVYRCFLYTWEKKRPIFLPSTPAPTTERELAAVLAERPLDIYRAGDGRSASKVDHYYDKLLHIVRPPPLPESHRVPALAYLEGRLAERVEPLRRVALAPRENCLAVLGSLIGDKCAEQLRDYNEKGQFIG
jgi:hypothetical protein